MRKNEGVVSKEHFNESRKIKKLCATALSKSERLARTTDLLGSEGRFVHKHKMEFFFENFLNQNTTRTIPLMLINTIKNQI